MDHAIVGDVDALTAGVDGSTGPDYFARGAIVACNRALVNLQNSYDVSTGMSVHFMQKFQILLVIRKVNILLAIKIKLNVNLEETSSNFF